MHSQYKSESLRHDHVIVDQCKVFLPLTDSLHVYMYMQTKNYMSRIFHLSDTIDIFVSQYIFGYQR